MSFLTPWKFQFDDTGTAVSNLIQNERKTIAANSIPFPLKEGMFYAQSVVIRNVVTNAVLTLGTDYTLVGADAYVTAKTGLTAIAAIEITNKTFTGDIDITYQCVGGAEGVPIGLVKDLIAALNNAAVGTTIDYTKDIVNLPIFFPPAPHGHALESLEQIELLTNALRDVTNALINRIPMTHSGNALQEQIDRIIGVIGSMRNSINAIAAVQGNSAQIGAILDTLTKLETITSKEVNIAAGATVLVGEWKATEINSVRGIVTAITATTVETTDFLLVCPPAGTPKISIYGNVGTGATILELSISRLGDDFRLSAKLSSAGKVKTKLVAAF